MAVNINIFSQYAIVMPARIRSPPQDVEHMYKLRDVEGLLKVAMQKDAPMEIRIMAIDALGEIGDSRAVEPLIELLKSDDYLYVRKRAAYTLYLFLKMEGLSDALRQKIMSHWRSWYLT